MLSLRLRGTHGIRTHYVCSSCCAHAPGATGAYRRGVAITRTYATKKKAAAPSPEKPPEEAKSSDATPEPEAAQPSQVRRVLSEEKKKRKKDVKTKESEKPAPRKKKAPTSSEADKDQNAQPVKPSNTPDTTVKLWQETLDVLKNLQQAQDAAERAAVGQAAQKKVAGGKGGDGETKRSLKSNFPPLQGGGPSKRAIERQAKLLEGTLDVLKSVLTVQADQRSKGSKKAETTKIPGATTKPERKQTVSKTKKEEAKKLPENSKQASEAAVAQGFAALVQSAQQSKKAVAEKEVPKQEVPKQEVPKRKSVAKAPPAPPKSLKEDGASDKSGNAWGSNKAPRNIMKIRTKNTGLEPVDVDTAPVPRVEYGLDRVLFNEGVYVLQDPRTRVFNFDPYLATIMPVNEFDFEALKQYVTSSKDTTLIGVAKKHNKKFTGSTSSMTSTLAHFHFLLSAWRPINSERISKGYEPDSTQFGVILRAPAATFLHYKDGTYAIDADKEYDTDTILSMLGKSMEKLLTAPREEYEKYRRSNSHQLTEEERNAEESYHYTTYGDFMMRSQLDAYDPRLPGTGVFDLKTRAVVSIRMDARNHEKGIGYEIRQRQGQWESFEREYYDLIRLAFLKYSLQVRMGRMDGIFVAYHNTARIFGFQYIPLEEMDLSLHGTTDLSTGHREFMASLQLYEEMLKKATERFPNKSLRIHVETRPSSVVPFMYFFAEPVNDDEIKAIQEQNKEEGEKFQERVLGIRRKTNGPVEAARADLDQAEEAAAEDVDEAEVETESKEEAVEEAREAEEDAQEIDEEDSEDVWEDMMEVVEQTMESDAQGISAIRDAIEDALEQSGLLHARSSEEAEQYVEALLKAMVDVDAEKASTGEEAMAEVPEGETQVVEQQEPAQDVRATVETGTVDKVESSPPASSKISRFSFLSSWFGSGTKEPETTAEQDVSSKAEQDVSSKAESEQNIGTFPEQDSAVKDDGPEADVAESKAGDHKPDDSLKDLLIKLTTRIGSSGDAQKTTEELSEDQAKLRNFESILLDMMPKTQEAPDEAEVEEDATVTGDKNTEAPEDTAAAAGAGEEPTAKPVLGLILTVRNKVNGKYVQRPEKLVSGEKWHVEYTIEEVAEDKVQNLYEMTKKRRHKAHFKEPGRDVFRSAFDGQLPHYSRAGKAFRRVENRLARKLPLHVAWQDEPLQLRGVGTGSAGGLSTPSGTSDASQKEEAQSAFELYQERRGSGVTRDMGQPSWDSERFVGKKPFGANLPPGPRENPRNLEFPKRPVWTMKSLELTEVGITKTTKGTVEEDEVVEQVAEKRSASFREWRESSQQRQDKDQENEEDNAKSREKEKDS